MLGGMYPDRPTGDLGALHHTAAVFQQTSHALDQAVQASKGAEGLVQNWVGTDADAFRTDYATWVSDTQNGASVLATWPRNLNDAADAIHHAQVVWDASTAAIAAATAVGIGMTLLTLGGSDVAAGAAVAGEAATITGVVAWLESALATVAGQMVRNWTINLALTTAMDYGVTGATTGHWGLSNIHLGRDLIAATLMTGSSALTERVVASKLVASKLPSAVVTTLRSPGITGTALKSGISGVGFDTAMQQVEHPGKFNPKEAIFVGSLFGVTGAGAGALKARIIQGRGNPPTGGSVAAEPATGVAKPVIVNGQPARAFARPVPVIVDPVAVKPAAPRSGASPARGGTPITTEMPVSKAAPPTPAATSRPATPSTKVMEPVKPVVETAKVQPAPVSGGNPGKAHPSASTDTKVTQVMDTVKDGSSGNAGHSGHSTVKKIAIIGGLAGGVDLLSHTGSGPVHHLAPAGTTPGGTTPSGTTPGVTIPGGATPGGTTHSGTTTGGTTPSGTTPGGTTGGGSATTSGTTSGGTTSSGSTHSATTPGVTPPSATTHNVTTPSAIPSTGTTHNVTTDPSTPIATAPGTTPTVTTPGDTGNPPVSAVAPGGIDGTAPVTSTPPGATPGVTTPNSVTPVGTLDHTTPGSVVPSSTPAMGTAPHGTTAADATATGTPPAAVTPATATPGTAPVPASAAPASSAAPTSSTPPTSSTVPITGAAAATPDTGVGLLPVAGVAVATTGAVLVGAGSRSSRRDERKG
ncbi:MAG: hypothetical protein ACR2GX_02665 [Candidatus Dormibacteria bacterium]